MVPWYSINPSTLTKSCGLNSREKPPRMKHALGGELSVSRTLYVALADKSRIQSEVQRCRDLGHAGVLKSVSRTRVDPVIILEESRSDWLARRMILSAMNGVAGQLGQGAHQIVDSPFSFLWTLLQENLSSQSAPSRGLQSSGCFSGLCVCRRLCGLAWVLSH
jgi:hypothetical protein